VKSEKKKGENSPFTFHFSLHLTPHVSRLTYLRPMYLTKTPWWLRALYPSLVWRMPSDEKKIYLTFDDGPHPTATAFVLDQLAAYHAKASFFCIGKNAAAEPELYQRIISEGHAVGNHTHQHLNGWQTSDDMYLADTMQAAQYISSHLFRPPYGRIKRSQIKMLQQKGMKIIMWDVLSADFDTRLTGEASLSYVLYHTKPGSIVLFHDSAKAWDRLSAALPAVLKHFTSEGYVFDRL
jgi:peptidoglycan/xylan/chitin deacetylase (PgdA/CDA1 family)